MEDINQLLVVESDLYDHGLRRKSDGKEYNIEAVYVEKWEGGWFFKLLIECDQSHAVVYWQNITCPCPTVKEICTRTQKNYELI